jgi:hypothetical protein
MYVIDLYLYLYLYLYLHICIYIHLSTYLSYLEVEVCGPLKHPCPYLHQASDGHEHGKHQSQHTAHLET